MATIEDVKALLLKGLDPRNTVNQLNQMLKDEEKPEAPVADAPVAEEKKKKTFRKK